MIASKHNAVNAPRGPIPASVIARSRSIHDGMIEAQPWRVVTSFASPKEVTKKRRRKSKRPRRAAIRTCQRFRPVERASSGSESGWVEIATHGLSRPTHTAIDFRGKGDRENVERTDSSIRPCILFAPSYRNHRLAGWAASRVRLISVQVQGFR
jgi:hypothetical protein